MPVTFAVAPSDLVGAAAIDAAAAAPADKALTAKRQQTNGGQRPASMQQGNRQASQSSTASSSSKSPSLRGNLTRQNLGRSPCDTYDLLKILGEGSMGSVCKVRKKTIGGSARYNAAERAQVQEKWDNCFSIPILGGLFRLFLNQVAAKEMQQASFKATPEIVLPNSQDVISFGQKQTGEGGESVASPSRSGMHYALKSIHVHLLKDDSFVEELKNEIAILKTLDHPHIVRVMETFHHDGALYVVMELCSGGDLYTRDPYNEQDCARITSNILSAVSYMHDHGVVHRDLKYENVLFVNNSPRAEIKLIDFGLAKEVQEHEGIKEGVGTIYTMAPEVLNGQGYSKQVDLWSIGVITFMLASSQMPFFGSNRAAMAEKIVKGEYTFKGRAWKNISEQCKAFIQNLLVVDPEDRFTAEEALAASWLHRRHGATVRNPHAGELANVKRCIQRYVKYPKMRRLSLMLVAHQSNSEEIGILRKVFQHYDTNQSGSLDYESFKGALNDAGFTEEDYHEIFDAVDIDGTGKIRYTEFLAATLEAAGWISEERLAEAFDRVDHDNTGYITKENLRFLLGPEFPESEIESIMGEAASNERGVSYLDFLRQWDDNREEFEREWRKHMVPGMVVDSAPDNSESDDLVSELSFDADDPSRSTFVERKTLSERKLQILQAD